MLPVLMKDSDKLMTEISDHIIDVDTITNTVEKRRTCVWYEPFENFYDGILQVANMQSFFKEHSAGFHTVQSIWKNIQKVTIRWTLGHYRLFHLSFQKSLRLPIFCWMICSSTLSIKWKDSIIIGS